MNKGSLVYSNFTARAIPNGTVSITSPAVWHKQRIRISNTPSAAMPPPSYLQVCMALPLHTSLDPFKSIRSGSP